MPDQEEVKVVLTDNAHRVKKLFDSQNAQDFKNMSKAFAQRIEHEFLIAPSLKHLDYFSQSRANLFRLTPFLPIIVLDLDEDAKKLYSDIMGEAAPQRRQPPAKVKLTAAFEKFGVRELLDVDPEPVIVPGLKHPVRADFGYQNGAYNLIDAVSFARVGNEFDVFSKAVIEAQLVHDFSDKKFTIVAELSNDRRDLFNRLEDQLGKVGARVFQLDQLENLVSDISQQAKLHLRG
jgi:hypothetical protein